MKSLTSKAVPPDRRLPNQLHGWLAKSALNPRSRSLPFLYAQSLFSFFFKFEGASGLFLALWSLHLCSLLVEAGEKAKGGKSGRVEGSETRDEVVARVSLGRIRKQRMRDWLDGETSRGRDRGTGLNKQRSGWWCRK